MCEAALALRRSALEIGDAGAAEQRALEQGRAHVDLSARGVVRVAGPDRLSWLHSMTTQHLADLGEGIAAGDLLGGDRAERAALLELVRDVVLSIARGLGIPYIPTTPFFPWLGPLGLVPLPSKWIIEFGEPVDTASLGPAAADDPMLVFDLTDQVRETIQQTLYSLLMARRSVFF